MRYELSDYEWTAIKPMLPNKPRGVRRVNDRRVLNGIFWVLRSGAPWRDVPEKYGPRTTCYNRFVRLMRRSWPCRKAERRLSRSCARLVIAGSWFVR
ncbi:transposase [Bradyrhizobium sp. USDA 3364]